MPDSVESLSTTMSLRNIICNLKSITISSMWLLQNRSLGVCVFRLSQVDVLKMMDIPKPASKLGDLDPSLNS